MVRARTLLVEQRNIAGTIVAGQKVRGFHPRAIDWIEPARRDAAGIDRLPPYDLRHAFASLQIRAGMSIPELAEQMGHAPATTLASYTHVIRELKGRPALPAAEQIDQARAARGRVVDVAASG